MIPEIFATGLCIDNTLPVINSDEILPIWWQVELTTGARNSLVDNCSELSTGTLTSYNWILKNTMKCDLGVYI